MSEGRGLKAICSVCTYSDKLVYELQYLTSLITL